jgi:hypothetical protein
MGHGNGQSRAPYEIETEFRDKMAAGWFAVDINGKRDKLIREFDPNAEILLIPRVQGG